MKQRFYFDTCIWRDFYENRVSKTGNPLGGYATALFTKILKNKDQILFSEALVWELKRDYNEEEINNMLTLLFITGILIKVKITKGEYAEARKLCQERNIPFIDCLNAVQSRNHKATLVSQDEHFFNKLSDITKSVRPQDIS